MDRIGKKALRDVLQQRVEKALRVNFLEFGLARFNFLKHVVLLVRRKLSECLTAEACLAILVEPGKPFSIEFSRRER